MQNPTFDFRYRGVESSYSAAVKKHDLHFFVDSRLFPVLQAGSIIAMSRKKKRAMKILFVWLLLLLSAIASIPASELCAVEAPVRFPLVYGAMSGNSAPLWIAREQGFFKKYGLDPQLVFIIAGRAAQAMLSGEINVGVIGGTHVANAVTSGGDMTMLLGLETKLDYFLVARPAIKSAENLKGKKVAIGTPSGTASLAAYVGLDYLGLVPKRDNITLLGVGGPPERLAALLAGSVDAASVSPDVAQAAVNQGYTVLLDLAKENVPFQSSGLVTSRKFMKSNPQLVENVARAIVEGVAFARNPANKKLVLQSLARNLRLDKPDLLEKTYKRVDDLPPKPCPNLAGVDSVLKLLVQHGLNPKAAQLKREDIVDMSLCKKFDESGFMDRLYQGS
jgi:NitT/TauT family transport system substrate-binding protein